MVRIRPFLLLLALLPALGVGARTALAGGPDPTEDGGAGLHAAVTPATRFDQAEAFEIMQGGAGTAINPVTADALAHADGTLDEKALRDFALGKALFRKLWVPAPSSTAASGGLGPLFNAPSCESCHRRDGRGTPPSAEDTDPVAAGLLIKLARPSDDHPPSGTLPDPVYGVQIQDRAVAGLAAEADVSVTNEHHEVTLADGQTVRLVRPVFHLPNLRYGPLGATTGLSARLAPPLSGLGLIEAIADADILASADPDDADRDGISGRARQSAGPDGQSLIGRFGWKASVARLIDQTQAAALNDMGLSSLGFGADFGDCMPAQRDCRAQTGGSQPLPGPAEMSAHVVDQLSRYVAHLAVPARRQASFPAVLAGKKLFYDFGCVACHRPKYLTPRDATDPASRSRLIWPYSDFLLHDMGAGLADPSPAAGPGTGREREWKTPPLWGIGLTKTVSGVEHYLHDGRARSLTEAILWHGGEGEAARIRFQQAVRTERDALLGFLQSL